MFGEFNKVAKFDAFLHDLKFDIAVAIAKEIFDKFLARFISAITSLDFRDCHNVSTLQRTISECLCFKMANSTTYISFSKYQSRCRQCDFDFCQAYEFSNRNQNDKNNSNSFFSKSQGRQTRNTKEQAKNLNCYWLKNATSTFSLRQLKQQLMKKC